MDGTSVWVAASLYLSCYGLAVASAMLPWLNAEAIVLSLCTAARSWPALAVIALLATAGQVTGKGAMYWMARTGAGQARLPARAQRWQARLARRSTHPIAWVFLSAVVGVPPLYLVTLLAGAARVSFGRFLAAAAVGRLLHFGALVCVPGVLLR